MLSYSLSLDDLCVDSGTPVGGDSLSRTLSCTELKCYTQRTMKQPQLHANLGLSGTIRMKKDRKVEHGKLAMQKSNIVYIAGNQHVYVHNLCIYIYIYIYIYI